MTANRRLEKATTQASPSITNTSSDCAPFTYCLGRRDATVVLEEAVFFFFVVGVSLEYTTLPSSASPACFFLKNSRPASSIFSNFGRAHVSHRTPPLHAPLSNFILWNKTMNSYICTACSCTVSCSWQCACTCNPHVKGTHRSELHLMVCMFSCACGNVNITDNYVVADTYQL